MTPLNTIIEEEKKAFEEKFQDPMEKKHGKGFALYCSYCDGTWRDGIKDFLTTAIQRAYEAGQSEERAKIIKEVFEVEKEKWNDAVHCTCLGYALVKLAGGEDSEGGKKMEERLLKLTPDYKDKTDDTLTN